MFHLADGSGSFAVALLAGRHSFIPKFDPVAVLKAVGACQVTHAVLVPTMMNMVVNHPEVTAHDLSSLDVVLYGASPMPAAVIERALRSRSPGLRSRSPGRRPRSPGTERRRPGRPRRRRRPSRGPRWSSARAQRR